MTEWKLSHAAKGLRPLAVLPDGLVCHRRGALYKVGHDLQDPTPLCRLPVQGAVGRIARQSRLLDRIFRVSPSHAVVLDDAVFVARRSQIWRCDLSDGRLSLDFVIPDGRRSLGFGLIAQPDGRQEVVFGEYFENLVRRPVRIWGRSARGAGWTERAVFGAGEIEHVHAVTAVDGQVYVLTGDFGPAAGIWTTDVTFAELRPLARGRQAFRAAWMEALAGRVYFATDTQLEANHLHEFLPEAGVASLRSVVALGGSSIYAGRGPDEIFFSTTIECGEPSGNLLKDIFDTKPGPGMLSSSASIQAVDAQGRVSELFSAPKDAWPFRLAQFGTFMFPSGLMPANTLVAYGVALRGVDDVCLVFKRS